MTPINKRCQWGKTFLSRINTRGQFLFIGAVLVISLLTIFYLASQTEKTLPPDREELAINLFTNVILPSTNLA